METSETPISKRHLVLASSSPARRALIHKLGLPFDWMSPAVDEAPLSGEPPKSMATRISIDKARAGAAHYPDAIIIASDQVAWIEDQQLTKPLDRINAIGQLQQSSGKCVDFFTGICVLDARSGEWELEVDQCRVQFRTLSQRQIENYVDREAPFECAGSFKSEGLGIALFEWIRGDDPNALVGLPLIRLITMLESFGVEVL